MAAKGWFDLISLNKVAQTACGFVRAWSWRLSFAGLKFLLNPFAGFGGKFLRGAGLRVFFALMGSGVQKF